MLDMTDTTDTARSDASAEGGKPQEGKRSDRHDRRGGHHNRRGGNRRPNDRPTSDKSAGEEAGGASRPAPDTPTRDNQPRGDRKKQNGNQPRQKSGDRKGDGRENRENRSQATPAQDKGAAPRSAVDKPQASGSRPSAGRPQRVTHHAPEAAIPDMQDLLIEDTAVHATPTPAADDTVDMTEVERILAHDPFAAIGCSPALLPEDLPGGVLPEGQVLIVGIRYRSGGKTYFFDPRDLRCEVGQYAIVETARGIEFGEVCMANRLVDESSLEHALAPVIRIATRDDILRNEANREREEEAFKIGLEKIAAHKLDMKLVSVQYTFDNSKLLFYFTSERRVDFRELVKDLASVFHIRIELRQIGIRDEARMLGGLGACGRPLCCSSFLTDFGQVSMKMAKEQNLSLNSSKISGCCGRLMCCLRYEHETYVEEIRRTPAVGTFVTTPDGPGVVTEIFPLQGEVKVNLKNKPESGPAKYHRDLVELQYRTRPEAPTDTDIVADAEPDAED